MFVRRMIWGVLALFLASSGPLLGGVDPENRERGRDRFALEHLRDMRDRRARLLADRLNVTVLDLYLGMRATIASEEESRVAGREVILAHGARLLVSKVSPARLQLEAPGMEGLYLVARLASARNVRQT
jgi:hypothetical protein